MGIFDTVKKNLEDRGYAVEVFASGAEAAAYLDGAVDGKSVGFGGSLTLEIGRASCRDRVWYLV